MVPTFLDQFDGHSLDGLEFCRLVYAVFEHVRLGESGARKLRMRQRPEKRLLEELLPICRYVHARYGPGCYMTVKWVGEGGAYDAEVAWHGGRADAADCPRFSFIEVTGAQHPNEYLVREALNSGLAVFGVNGLKTVKDEGGRRQIVAVPTLHTHRSHVDELAIMVLDAIKTKMRKNYPEHTALVVDCTLNSVYTSWDWELLVVEVSRQLPQHSFMEILMVANVSGYSDFVYRRPP
ncbi:hypothetical protein [Variovorax sp. PAMC26660]|uniref:hypothetical protein n=1 Tax=Variovorax sp. PAMC26660 TaxID=2762322 RepID=UPI00164DBE5F|nr:hypothetical protein [Variovorax sp. PAMC26660]QNK70558.1 hypothetical protein H7F35_13130 [Variovorax sp. PAMC26660]